MVKPLSKVYEENEANSYVQRSDGQVARAVQSELITNGGDAVSQQNPLPCDGDSVYTKDIWLEESTTNGWVGCEDCDSPIAFIPFNNLHTHIINESSDNPKTLFIHFRRTIAAHQVGLGCYDTNFGDFSNVKIELIGSSGVIRTAIDDSADNTKYNSRNYSFEPELFNAIRIEFHTTDAVCISNITIQKSINTDSTIKAKSDLSKEVENINSYRNALQIDNGLVHEKGVNLFFFRELGVSTTLSQPSLLNDTTITVTDSTGFSVGDKIKLTTDVDVGQSFLTITAINGNVITLDRPLSSTLSSGSTVDLVSVTLSDTAGSLDNPIIYRIKPPNSDLSLRWQLTRMLIAIADNLSMDDGKFGGIPALTNGINIRVVKGSGEYRDLTNWKDNGDMAEDMYDVLYTDRARWGQYGLRGRWTFTKAEFVVDLDGANGDYLELRVQDNLTGLQDFEIKCQGRLFGG